MKLISLSTFAILGSTQARSYGNPVVDSIYQNGNIVQRNVRAPTFPSFNSNYGRIPSQYKSSRFMSNENLPDNNNKPYNPEITSNTIKKRVRVTLDHPNCKSLPNISDVQRRVESDPVIQRKLGVQIAGVLVNKFACTESKTKLTVDFDFYVYNDINAADFDILFNQNNYDDGTNNVQGFEDQVKDGSLEPTLLKAIGMYHRISPYATEKPMISVVSLISKDTVIQETADKLSESIEKATTQITTLADQNEKNEEIIEQIVNLTLNDRTLLDHIDSLAQLFEDTSEENPFTKDNLIENLAVKITNSLHEHDLTIENIPQLQKIAAKEIVDYMTNFSNNLDVEKTKILQEETDPAIEESGNEGIFENEVVESILDSDYSSQLDKLTREVEKSIEDREIQEEFLEDQKQFVKDLFGDEASDQPQGDYDLLEEDSSTQDIEDLISNDDANLEGDVVELLNSLSKNDENQEDALKAILQEITQNNDDGNNNNNDLKDMLLEYRDEPEIEVSATEIVSEIMPDFFDEASDERKQERQEALLQEIQAEEEAKNEFKNTISEIVTKGETQEEEKENEEPQDIDDKLTQEENSFESIEDEAEIDSSIEEADKFAEILERDQIESIDLEKDLVKSAKQVDLLDVVQQQPEENFTNNSTLVVTSNLPGPINSNITVESEEDDIVSLDFNENLPESHSFAENVVETVLSMFSR